MFFWPETTQDGHSCFKSRAQQPGGGWLVLVLRDREEHGHVQEVAVEVAEEVHTQLLVALGVLARPHVVGEELEEVGNWGGGVIIGRGTCNAVK